MSNALTDDDRIREDTAKYLYNLDTESAYYDPKSRSMRENPLKEKSTDDVEFAGDNFVRYTGETSSMAKTQLFAWQAAERGSEVHLQANPTQVAILHKEYESKKDKVRDSTQKSILARYGGEEHLAAPPKELLLAQNENYVEYSRTGRVIKGQERAKARSKYEEDGKLLDTMIRIISLIERVSYSVYSKSYFCMGILLG